jgi:putative endonuclease
MTNYLLRRVDQHKKRLLPGFTAKYGLTDLVYYEQTDNVWTALEREKQLKGWTRKRKVELIRSVNPEWRDLSGDL